MNLLSANVSSGSSSLPSPSPSLLEQPQISSASSATLSDGISRQIDPAGALLADTMHAFERLLEATMLAGNEVNAAAVRARLAHGVPQTISQPFFSEVDRATSSVVAALEHMLKGHRIAKQLGRRVGAPTAYGDTGADDDDKVFGGA